MKQQLAPKAAAVALAALALGGTAFGQSSDALIDKLVEKGILSSTEANQLRDEADSDFAKSLQIRNGMPDWVTSVKINGDFRARYEGFWAGDPSFADRNRFRYRMRFGAVATIKDNFEVGLRFTSSEAQAGTFGGDPISGNTTFSDNASKKFVYIDLAYAKWTAINNQHMSAISTVGKMENPFVFSDMVFDGDYTPEGFAQQLIFNVHENHTLRSAFGGFVMDEQGGSTATLGASRDTYLLGAQLRADSKWNKHISTTAGIAALGILNDEGLINGNIPNINVGNTRVAVGADSRPAYNFNPIVADAAITYTMESFPMYNAAFPIRLGVEYMNNPAAPSRNEAYAAGLTFGKSGKKGLWDLSYRYKVLEGDAWFEELVDSDFGAFYGGTFAGAGLGGGYRAGTNIRGHVIKASYSPFDALTLGMTLFLTEAIDEVPIMGRRDSDMTRLQVDAVWKF